MTEPSFPPVATLEKILEKTEENNRILKAMRRDAIIGATVKVIFWIVLLVASYYFTMQYLDPILSSFNQATEGMDKDEIQQLIDAYRGQLGQ